MNTCQAGSSQSWSHVILFWACLQNLPGGVLPVGLTHLWKIAESVWRSGVPSCMPAAPAVCDVLTCGEHSLAAGEESWAQDCSLGGTSTGQTEWMWKRRRVLGLQVKNGDLSPNSLCFTPDKGPARWEGEDSKWYCYLHKWAVTLEANLMWNTQNPGGRRTAEGKCVPGEIGPLPPSKISGADCLSPERDLHIKQSKAAIENLFK